MNLSAFIPKTYIADDRGRMDVYRRLTRCTSLRRAAALAGARSPGCAYGESAASERRYCSLYGNFCLLAGLYGIESIIKKDPDVILTVTDINKAQLALAGRSGDIANCGRKDGLSAHAGDVSGGGDEFDGPEEPDTRGL